MNGADLHLHDEVCIILPSDMLQKHQGLGCQTQVRLLQQANVSKSASSAPIFHALILAKCVGRACWMMGMKQAKMS